MAGLESAQLFFSRSFDLTLLHSETVDGVFSAHVLLLLHSQ